MSIDYTRFFKQPESQWDVLVPLLPKMDVESPGIILPRQDRLYDTKNQEVKVIVGEFEVEDPEGLRSPLRKLGDQCLEKCQPTIKQVRYMLEMPKEVLTVAWPAPAGVAFSAGLMVVGHSICSEVVCQTAKIMIPEISAGAVIVGSIAALVLTTLSDKSEKVRQMAGLIGAGTLTAGLLSIPALPVLFGY